MIAKSPKKLLISFLTLFFVLSIFSFARPIATASINPTSAAKAYSNNPVSSSGDLDEKFFLFNTSLLNFPENPSGLIPNVEDQKQSNLCWAFSSLSALETSLYTLSLVSKSTPLNFSELDLAHNTLVHSRGWENFGEGGAFEVAYEYLSSDAGPVNEGAWEKASSANSVWSSGNGVSLANFYSTGVATHGREPAGFSVLETTFFPSRTTIKDKGTLNGLDESEVSEQELANRTAIKNHIQNFGGVTATMYFDRNTYFDGIFYYCYNRGQLQTNHMVTLVGWNDDVIIKGKVGAYIAQNSYGTSFGSGGFFYISYADEFIEDNVCGFTRIAESLSNSLTYDNMQGSDFENQFVTFNPTRQFYSMSYYSYSSSVFTANIYPTLATIQDQYLSRIKVPTMSVNSAIKNTQDEITGYLNYDASSFKLFVLNNLSSYSQNDLKNNFNYKIPIKNAHPHTTDDYLFSSNQTGYYTVELDQEIFLLNDYFAIIFELQNGQLFFMNNDPENFITHGTFKNSQTNGNGTWSLYSSSSNVKCVLPMKVQTQFILGDIDASVQGGTFTYDGLPHNPTVQVASPLNYLVSYSLDGITFSSALPNLKNVKITNGQVVPYTVFVKISADFYNDLVVQTDIRINPKNLTITPQSVSITYGDVYVQPVVQSIAGYVSGESAKTSGVLSVGQGFNQAGLNNVGDYDIVQSNFNLLNNGAFLLSNYSISFISGVKYTVLPKVLTIIPDALSKSYGDDDPLFTCHFSGVEGSQLASATLSLSRQSGEAVGNYALSLSSSIVLNDDVSTGFFASNYIPEFSTEPAFFFITPRVLTVNPETNQSKIFDEEDPTFTFSLSNSLSGEPFALSGSLSRTNGEDVGNYQLTLGSLALVDNPPFLTSNYTLEIAHEVVYFTILGATISDNFVSDISVEYNGEFHFIEHTATQEYTFRVSQTFLPEDDFNEQIATSENIGKKDVGTHYLVFEFKKENYAPKYEKVKITISPLPLVIIPKVDQSKVYGEEDDLSLFTFQGEIFGEVPAFGGVLSRESGENVGDYLITAGNLSLQNSPTFLASNYYLVFDNSALVTYEITPKTLTITPDDALWKYYGTSTPTLTFGISGFEFDDTATPNDFSGKLSFDCEEENAGEYAITLGTLSLQSPFAPNYTLALSNQTKYFIIHPAGIEISLFNLTDAQGNLLKNYYGEWTFDNVSYQFNEGTELNFVDGDSLMLHFLCYENDDTPLSLTTPKGDYHLTALSLNANYTVTVHPTTFTISYRTYTVTFIVDDIQRTKNIEHFAPVGSLPNDIPSLPTPKEGYAFIHWQKSINGTDWTMVENITTEIIETTTIFEAKMEVITYTITYFLNGGTSSDANPSTYTIESSTLPLIAPTKHGHTFQGFFKSSTFAEDPVTQIEQGSTGNISLYAKWKANEYTITRPISGPRYTLTTIPSDLKISFGTTYFFYVNLTAKYNRSYSTLTVQVIWATAPTSPQTLSPTPVPSPSGNGIQHLYIVDGIESDFELTISGVETNTYTVSFLIGREAVQTRSVPHGNSLAVADFPTLPEKQFYDDTPAVWSITSDVLNVTSDLNIYAIYTPNTYIITFVMKDGRQIQVQTTYGSPVDISVLEDEYSLNIFEHFVFSSPLQNISESQTINVEIVSTIHIFYLIVAALSVLIILGITFNIIIKKRRRKG